MNEQDETYRLVDDYADYIVRRENASHWLAANRYARLAYAAYARVSALGA